jgi:hypothetical protein
VTELKPAGAERAETASPDGEKDPRSLVAAVFVFGILAGVLPLSLLDFTLFVGDSTNVVLAYVVVAYSAFMIARVCYSGGGQITRLAFFLFCYVFMGISVFVQVADLQFPLQADNSGAYTSALIRHAILTVIVGIGAFEVGSLVTHGFTGERAGKSTANKRDRKPPRIWKVSRSRVIGLGIFGLIVTAYYVSRVGVAPFFNSRQAASNAILGTDNPAAHAYAATNKLGRAAFRVLAQTPVLLSLFGILYLKHHKLWDRVNKRSDAGVNVLIVLLIAANVIVNGPTGNSRYWFSTVAIALVSVYVPLSKRKGVRWAAILAVFTLLFAFTTLQAFRREGGARSYSTGFRNDLLTAGTYSDFQIELVGSQWIAQNGHTHGRQLLSSLLVFVPRSIWPNKPPDTGNLILPAYNPAASLWTEGDVEFGWAGVGFYFVLLGAGTAAFDRRLRTARPGSLAHAAIPIAGGFMILVLRGSMLTVVAAAYGLTAVLLLITTRKRGDPEPAAVAVDVGTG